MILQKTAFRRTSAFFASVAITASSLISGQPVSAQSEPSAPISSQMRQAVNAFVAGVSKKRSQYASAAEWNAYLENIVSKVKIRASVSQNPNIQALAKALITGLEGLMEKEDSELDALFDQFSAGSESSSGSCLGKDVRPLTEGIFTKALSSGSTGRFEREVKLTPSSNFKINHQKDYPHETFIVPAKRKGDAFSFALKLPIDWKSVKNYGGHDVSAWKKYALFMATMRNYDQSSGQIEEFEQFSLSLSPGDFTNATAKNPSNPNRCHSEFNEGCVMALLLPLNAPVDAYLNYQTTSYLPRGVHESLDQNAPYGLGRAFGLRVFMLSEEEVKNGVPQLARIVNGKREYTYLKYLWSDSPFAKAAGNPEYFRCVSDAALKGETAPLLLSSGAVGGWSSSGGGTSSSGSSSGGVPADWPFADRDPGSGLWIPKGSEKLFVVDRSETPTSTTSHMPGAANGGSAAPGSQTYGADYYSVPGKPTVAFNPGNVIAIRARTPKASELEAAARARADLWSKWTRYYGDVRLRGWVGSNLTGKWDVSVSRIPWDFSNPDCSVIETTSPQPMILFGSGTTPWIRFCTVRPDTDYYVNLRSYSDPQLLTKDSEGTFQRSPASPDSDCRKSEIQCQNIYVLIHGLSAPFGGTSPSAGGQPPSTPPSSSSSSSGGGTPSSPPSGESNGSYGSCSGIWSRSYRYRVSGSQTCHSAGFRCSGASLFYGTQFSPAPPQPPVGTQFYTDDACSDRVVSFALSGNGSGGSGSGNGGTTDISVSTPSSVIDLSRTAEQSAVSFRVAGVSRANTRVCAEVLVRPGGETNAGYCASDASFVERTETPEWKHDGSGWNVTYRKDSTSWTSVPGLKLRLFVMDAVTKKRVTWTVDIVNPVQQPPQSGGFAHMGSCAPGQWWRYHFKTSGGGCVSLNYSCVNGQFGPFGTQFSPRPSDPPNGSPLYSDSSCNVPAR